MLRITYNALGVKLTGTLQVCDGFARSKAKACVVRKNTYTRSSQMGENIFVDTTGPFPEILIGNWYCIGVVNDYSRYSLSFFTKTKLQLKKKMEDLFKNMTSRGTPLKYLCCDNTEEHQSKFQKACEKEKFTL